MLQADATDSDGTIVKVEFYNGTDKLGEDTSSPFSFHWTGVAAGNYTLRASAIDNLGATNVSTNISIIVRNSVSPILLRDVATASGNFTFSIQTESNWTYTVEFVNDLGSGAWQTLRTIQGNGMSVIVEDAISGSSARWYRVLAR